MRLLWLLTLMSSLCWATKPVFDLANNMRMVLLPADTKTGSVIYKLRASDADEDYPLAFSAFGKDSSIIDIQPPECDIVCEADVLLTRPLDRTRTTYELSLEVRDTRNEKTIVQAHIRVTTQMGAFVRAPRIVEISEDLRADNTLIESFTVLSNPNVFRGVTCRLMPLEYREVFEIGPGLPTIIENESRCDLRLKQKLDYETQSAYVLRLVAENAWTNDAFDTRNVAVHEFVVQVLDVADTPPFFHTLSPVTTMAETALAGDVVTRVEARDGDFGNPRQIVYALDPTNKPYSNFFQIDPDTGVITVRKDLQQLRDEVDEPINLRVIAQEVPQSNQAIFRTSSDTIVNELEDGSNAMAAVDIAVVVLDVVNRRPRFLQSHYVTSLAENSVEGTVLVFEGGLDVVEDLDKVFRSKDYQPLLWVLNQFFRRVHATKPAASRHESAEIFVVCLGYKAPERIDPKFLDPKHVFSELDENEEEKEEHMLVVPKKKAKAEGYATGSTTLFKSAKASVFIMEEQPVHILNNFSTIELDQKRIIRHPKTTKEIVECCKDLKVLGMKELRMLKKWRDALKADFIEAEKIKKARAEAKEKKKSEQNGENDEENDEEEEEEDEEDEDMAELEGAIASAKLSELRETRRAKKRALKEKRKLAERINLKMIIPGDKGPIREEQGLFELKTLNKVKNLDRIIEQEAPAMPEEEDDESHPSQKKKVDHYDRHASEILDSDALFYTNNDNDDFDLGSEKSEDDDDDDDDYNLGDLGLKTEKMIEQRMRGSKKKAKKDLSDVDHLNEGTTNPLVVDLDEQSKESKKALKADMWFQRDIFKKLEEDNEQNDDVIEADLNAVLKSKEKKEVKEDKKEKKAKKEDKTDEKESSEGNNMEEDNIEDDDDKENEVDDEDSSSSSEDEAPQQPSLSRKRKKRINLSPEELALGQEMIYSRKRKRDIIDQGWNRFMFGEKDEELPSWFVEEEKLHMRTKIELDPAAVQYYKDRQRELNARTPKKVVEAKARKKRRMAKRLDKAKKKAEVLMQDADMGSREKANAISKLYRKAQSQPKKEVTYVVAKKALATGKRARRPRGIKGPYKQVDPRMKKDKSQDKGGNKKSSNNNKKSGGKKRGPKGRRAKMNANN